MPRCARLLSGRTGWATEAPRLHTVGTPSSRLRDLSRPYGGTSSIFPARKRGGAQHGSKVGVGSYVTRGETNEGGGHYHKPCISGSNILPGNPSRESSILLMMMMWCKESEENRRRTQRANSGIGMTYEDDRYLRCRRTITVVRFNTAPRRVNEHFIGREPRSVATAPLFSLNVRTSSQQSHARPRKLRLAPG